MFFIFSWLIFGLIVGCLAKSLHPGDEPIGYVPTLAIGVVGSFIGGGINYVLGMGHNPFQASGLLMSIIGGIIFCAAWRYYKLKSSDGGPKSFLMGKKIR
jgi:uncharacterized membrane protein YeaQ/YmgE (transglycosylase-associated protein family)